MLETVISFSKVHPDILNVSWKSAKIVLTILTLFIPTKKKTMTMIFSSFWGKNLTIIPKRSTKKFAEERNLMSGIKRFIFKSS